MYSDDAIAALIRAAAGEMLPGEGQCGLGSQRIVVPSWSATRGGNVAYAAFPTGDHTLAAFAASMGGTKAALTARIATAIRAAAAGEVSPAVVAAVEDAKNLVRKEVVGTRKGALKITIG